MRSMRFAQGEIWKIYLLSIVLRITYKILEQPMKKIFAAAVMCGVAFPAFAQSSVTLYGLIDEGIDFTNNAGGPGL
jgi:hypothetical protein